LLIISQTVPTNQMDFAAKVVLFCVNKRNYEVKKLRTFNACIASSTAYSNVYFLLDKKKATSSKTCSFYEKL